MTDEHFWHVYFTLVKKYLPEKAFTFSPDQDTLPAFSAAPGAHVVWGAVPALAAALKAAGPAVSEASCVLWAQLCMRGTLDGLWQACACWLSIATSPTPPAGSSGGGDDLSLLSSLGSQLTKLGSKLQQSGRSLAGAGEPASAATQAGAGSSGMDTSAGAATAGGGAAAGAAAAGSGGAPAAAAPSPKEESALEADPDLEAYLQVGPASCRIGGRSLQRTVLLPAG